jgi:polysaccharide deacetylase 2 family uncharacterized protein YibQ
MAIALIVIIVAAWWLLRSGPSEHGAFDDRLRELAAQRGVTASGVAADDPIRKVDGVFVRIWRIEFPNRAARDGFIGDLELEASEHGLPLALPEDLSAAIANVRVDLETEAFDLRLSLPQRTAEKPTPVPATPSTPTHRPTEKPRPAPDARGNLAILLDDGGQNLDLVNAAAALPDQVGFALLPFLPKTAETAEALHGAGHEIWLHLPMEPENYPTARPGPGALLMSMSETELRSAVHAAIDNVPHAVGVNNHMGSRTTADLRTMTWVMQEIKARGLVFIDSRTTARTVAEVAAEAQGVPTNRRHVFLDNTRKASAVRRQLAEAVTRCRLEGEIIAIGHMDGVTIQVLADELPGLSKRGADLVRPSELVR